MGRIPRISVLRMMTLVAAASLTMAAFRLHLSAGSFVACFLCLGLYRGFSHIDRSRTALGPPTAWRSFCALCDSLAVAVLIVGIPAAVAILVYFLVEPIHAPRTSHYDPGMNTLGLGFACMVGGWVASRLRRSLWATRRPDEPDRSDSTPPTEIS